jgi:hypothetical protein
MPIITADFLSPARHKQAQASAMYQRFRAVWGTTLVDGVEVFDEQLRWYKSGQGVRSDLPFMRFINKMGVEYSTLTNNEFKRVDTCFFKLNASKYSYKPMDLSDIAADLSGAFAIGDEFEISVTYGGDLKRYVKTHRSHNTINNTYYVDTAAIRATLHSDPLKYFANIALISAGEKDELLKLLRSVPNSSPVTKIEHDTTNIDRVYETLAVLDNGSMFEQIGGVYSERVTGVDFSNPRMQGAIVAEYSYIVKYKVIALPTSSSHIVSMCSQVARAVYDTKNSNSKNYYIRTNHVIDTKLKEAVLLMNNPSSTPYFYKGFLRVDAVESMKRKDFVKLLIQCFDSGTKMQKAKWYEKVIAIVIIIIAIVIIVFTWWTGVGTAVGGSMIALGLGLMYASVFLTLSLLLFAQAFPYATDQIQMIGGAATIVGYAAMAVGFYNIINQAFIQSATQAGNQAAIAAAAQNGATSETIMAAYNSATSNYTVGMFVDGIIDGVKESVMSMVDDIANASVSSIGEALSNITMGDVSGWMDNIGTGMSLYNQVFQDTQTPPVTSNEQSTKEDGLRGYFGALEMMNENDALYRMDMIKINQFGGAQTANVLAGMV